MARIRAVRTFGTNAHLRESLVTFRRGGEGLCTTLVEAAEGRLRALAEDLEGLRYLAFDKLVARFLTQASLPMLPVADAIQEREALAQACRKLPPESPFFACRSYPGFVRRMAATLGELRQWRLASDDLDRLAEGAEPSLASKLRSLAALDRDARDRLRAAAREYETDRMERCLGETLGESKPRLWVYLGTSYSPLQAEWLRWASLQGVEIVAVLDGHSRVSSLFRDAERMREALGAVLGESLEANGLATGLFAEQPPLDAGVRVRIFSAGDPLSECEWALRTLAEEVQSGTPWERAAIYVRNTDDYLPLLEYAAERFGVPLRPADRRPLIRNGLIRFLLAYLGAIGQAAPIGLRHLADSSYVGLPAPARERQRAAIALASGFQEPWLDLMVRIGTAEQEDQWLVDAARMAAKRDLPDVPFVEWADELADLLQSPWLAASTKEESPTRIADAAAAAKLQQALAHRAELEYGDSEPIDYEEFLRSLVALVEQTEFRTPIDTTPGVSVASTTGSLGRADVVCVLGMIEGSFPRRRSEDPILSDFEREAADALRPGSPRLTNSRDTAAAERDELVRLAAATGRELVLFYPQVGEDRDNARAFYLAEIERVAGGGVVKRDLPSAWIVPPDDRPAFAVDGRLREALGQPRLWPSFPELHLAEAQSAVAGIPEEGVSAADLRDAVRCPFQYTFRRRLGVFAARSSSRWWRLRQLPQAVGLAGSPDPAAARSALERALESEIESLAAELTPDDEHLLRAGGERLIGEWVDREFAAREIWPKDAGTQLRLASYGEGQTAEELPLSSRRLRLRGQLAAISDMKGYAVGQLYGARRLTADRGLDQIGDADLVELGVPLFALAKRRPDVALEVDTLGGERLLFVLPRKPEVELESRVGLKLRVVDLGEKKPFFERVKKVLETASEQIESGVIRPTPGDACGSCDYGELCRCHKDWGDEADPFAAEESDADE